MAQRRSSSALALSFARDSAVPVGADPAAARPRVLWSCAMGLLRLRDRGAPRATAMSERLLPTTVVGSYPQPD